MKILIIEDEKYIADFLKLSLSRLGHIVELSYDGEKGYELALASNYDILLLDLMLPSRSGMSLLRGLRENNINTPVILLSAQNSTENKIEGLELGADDYLPKPFSFDELNARINALLRRTRASYSTFLHFGELALDTVKHLAMVGSVEIKLTRREYSLLEYLMKNQNKVMTREDITVHTWNESKESNVVDVYIKRLRTKLGKDFRGENFIKNIRSVGYVLGRPEDL